MLFTIGNTKTLKGEKLGWMTAILHLAPADEATERSVCPMSTPQCREDCLYTAGRGQMPAVVKARVRRTKLYWKNPREFAWMLAEEIDVLHRKATRAGMQLAVRINGTSDLPALARQVKLYVEGPRFYDYTKIPKAWDYCTPGSIHYTFSRSESNEKACVDALRQGINVAVVFNTKKGEPLPDRWHIGDVLTQVIDGDVHDLRFLDPRGVIVGLRAKGRARKRTGGFVVQV